MFNCENDINTMQLIYPSNSKLFLDFRHITSIIKKEILQTLSTKTVKNIILMHSSIILALKKL